MKDIRPVQKDPYDKIKVHETEKEKEKEKFKEGNNKQTLNLFLAFFVSTVQKVIKFFGSKAPKNIAEDLLTNTIVELKSRLKEIQEEDVSSNLEFFQNFSREWKKVLKIYHLTRIDEHRKNLLKTLVDEFQKFPQNKEFSLSYYLKSHQNKGLIPHPFKEIVQSLYTSHQKNPVSSNLKKWELLLNKILTS